MYVYTDICHNFGYALGMDTLKEWIAMSFFIRFFTRIKY